MTQAPRPTTPPTYSDPALSAWDCGCDPRELHVCERHRKEGRKPKDLVVLLVQRLREQGQAQ